ncbi:hypothetical protein ALP26_03986 [Pseudomonas savastanoi pv. glycinea]|nr:hypothetical protein ALP26_03986 [Pseudomonas savastanoi pv. glycinea]
MKFHKKGTGNDQHDYGFGPLHHLRPDRRVPGGHDCRVVRDQSQERELFRLRGGRSLLRSLVHRHVLHQLVVAGCNFYCVLCTVCRWRAGLLRHGLRHAWRDRHVPDGQSCLDLGQAFQPDHPAGPAGHALQQPGGQTHCFDHWHHLGISLGGDGHSGPRDCFFSSPVSAVGA